MWVIPKSLKNLVYFDVDILHLFHQIIDFVVYYIRAISVKVTFHWSDHHRSSVAKPVTDCH